MSEKIIGDPEKLVEEALRGVEEELRSKLEEVSKGALKMIDDAFEEALKEAEEKASRILSDAQDKLAAERASLEAEFRMKLAEKRSEWIDKVVEEAVKRLSMFAQTDEYRQALEKLVLQAVSQIEADKIVLEANEHDRKILAEIARNLKKPSSVRKLLEKHSLQLDPEKIVSKEIMISDKPASILGGLRAHTPDSKIMVDYSLDLIIGQIARDMRARIARILFGGEG